MVGQVDGRWGVRLGPEIHFEDVLVDQDAVGRLFYYIELGWGKGGKSHI